jgi:hypothetical protein
LKKILSRIAVGALVLTFVAIVICFYIGEFNYAYGLILLLFFIFLGMGQIYQLKNDEYMYQKINRQDQNEDYTK